MEVYVVNHWARSRSHGCEAVFEKEADALKHARRDVGKRYPLQRRYLAGWIETSNGAVYGQLDEAGTNLRFVSAAVEGREVEKFEVR